MINRPAIHLTSPRGCADKPSHLCRALHRHTLRVDVITEIASESALTVKERLLLASINGHSNNGQSRIPAATRGCKSQRDEGVS